MKHGKKRKLIPPFLMLLAGAITIIVMFVKQYELKPLLTALLIVLFVFYMVGLCIQKMLDAFILANEKRAAQEGEVIEKEAENQEENQEETQEEVSEKAEEM